MARYAVRISGRVEPVPSAYREPVIAAVVGLGSTTLVWVGDQFSWAMEEDFDGRLADAVRGGVDALLGHIADRHPGDRIAEISVRGTSF